ncbi:LpqB family beta-propeller domain-containing protein [Amycolatopsis suaedae]|uniref:GerMN domain-containing protein n=1 Tax=Amycolatopsis suaedae TaxID=2510978 RepID=A0A4Q7JBH8_9PSEU|nr:LpqB family beta-propeller domain-containing protein [Amycolatopsis suaedae]RZQ63614.1 hypothetical protein EWH70_14490 [Amycolatopsis suaedae]
MKRLAAVLSIVVLVAGCATIPEESQPVAIPTSGPNQPALDLPQPARDLDPLDVVRGFVEASARPLEENAAARVYLEDAARKNWRPHQGLIVIQDVFGTVYGVGDEKSPDPNEQTVVVRGFSVGKLAPDNAFIPEKDAYQLSLRVRRQQDGAWRIVNPPTDLAITESAFAQNYFRVPVYFFAPDSESLVPDLRYVMAKPQVTLPGRVVDLLLEGPSEFLDGAVRNALERADTDTNVIGNSDGSLLVPLSGVDQESLETKKLIAAQIVLSLQSVTTSRIRIQVDGNPLVPGQEEWRPTDLPSYETATLPRSELKGLVSVGGRVRSLADGNPIPGPAGSGAYQVVSGAQSIDGRQLAVVERLGGRLRLRVGDYGREAVAVNLEGGSMTRPTWRPATSAGGNAGELWTVTDGVNVVRVTRGPDGNWGTQVVNADMVRQIGTITALRLSRDGTRVALVAGEKLVVASVVRTPDSVSLRSPRILQADRLTEVVDVDWASQDSLVAVTSSRSLSVVKVPVDGLRLDPFNSSNLTPPVHAVTAMPSRAVIVADSGGLWTASEVGEVWRPHEPTTTGDDARPFYPG